MMAKVGALHRLEGPFSDKVVQLYTGARPAPEPGISPGYIGRVIVELEGPVLCVGRRTGSMLKSLHDDEGI